MIWFYAIETLVVRGLGLTGVKFMFSVTYFENFRKIHSEIPAMELKSQGIDEALLWNKETPQVYWKAVETAWAFTYVIL